MLNIKRVDVREKVHSENSVYIGRYNKTYNLSPSPLANPYVIGKDGTRDEVVEKYRQWLWVQVQNNNLAFTELKRLSLGARKNNSLTLMCWCKENEKCHGDVIISCLNWMESNNIGD